MPTAYFLLNVALNHEAEVIDKVKQILTEQQSINFEKLVRLRCSQDVEKAYRMGHLINLGGTESNQS